MRTSPLQVEHGDAVDRWITVGDMRLPYSFRTAGTHESLAMADLSALARCGIKGPGAAEWLVGNGVPVPERHNRWVALVGGGMIGRLGHTEFFVEDGPRGNAVETIAGRFGIGAEGVYWVPHQDAAIVLSGARVNEVLVQTCNINFSAIDWRDRELVMTSMVGVSVLVISRENRYHLWCDPTFGPYLWRTLAAIVGELGGAPIGIGSIYPELK
ncbi:MAG: hypothetical protein ACKVQU_18865 [Burkholderiales bacterium]